MASADSHLLLAEMSRQARDPDLRDAGLSTWENLMVLIGLEDQVKRTRNSFPDLMLKEWAAENLVEKADEEEVDTPPSTQDILRTTTPVERLIKSANEAARGEMIGAGTLVAAVPKERSPHLLNRQYMHKVRWGGHVD